MTTMAAHLSNLGKWLGLNGYIGVKLADALAGVREMAVRRWAELKHKASPERRKQLRDDVLREILEEDLRGMREILGKTQVEMARLLESSQSEISSLERREDWLLSTIRRYVAALGGELEVVAVFGDKRIRLHSAA